MMFKPSFSIQNISKMTMMIFFITYLITHALADDENANGNALTNDILAHQLMIESGCIPLESWKMIRDGSRDGFIKGVCLPLFYQVFDPPNLDKPTPVSIQFRNKKILDIDERKKILTMNIDFCSLWQDPRIKARPSFMWKKLPSISKFRHIIWTPMSYPAIKNVKEIIPLNDPILSSLDLISGKDANVVLSRAVFPPNATVAITEANWEVKFFCKFDFALYPFDHQFCSFEMVDAFLDVNVYETTSFGWPEQKQKEFGGYEVKQKAFRVIRNTSLMPLCFFGIENYLTRQLETYIFRYYLPCNVIVITSFLSLIVPLSAIPGRIALMVTEMLTLMSIFIHQMVRKDIVIK